MRSYELMALFPLDDEKSKAGSEALKKALAEQGAEIEKEELFGDRDLAYEVAKQRRGRFMLYTINVNPDKIAALDGQFKFNTNLLRYIFVRLDEKKAQ